MKEMASEMKGRGRLLSDERRTADSGVQLVGGWEVNNRPDLHGSKRMREQC
jgi:hypothetical protein